LETKYSGKPASEKLAEIGEKLQALNATSYIVTNLEEIACILMQIPEYKIIFRGVELQRI